MEDESAWVTVPASGEGDGTSQGDRDWTLGGLYPKSNEKGSELFPAEKQTDLYLERFTLTAQWRLD